MKHLLSKRTSVFALCIVCCCTLTGWQESPDVPSQNTDEKKNSINISSASISYQKLSAQGTVTSRLLKYLNSNQISGSIAIEKNSRVIFNGGTGYANLKTKELNKAATVFPIASITKSIVATSIMQLKEKKKLSINDPLSKYLSNFSNGKKVKLIHLLDHTSGINSPSTYKGLKTPLDVIKSIQRRSLKFQPGTKWDYQDVNYVILGYILEKVTGQPLHTYIKNNIINKAGMKHTDFTNQSKSVTAVGYLKKNGQLIPGTISSSTFLYGFGDMISTSSDICLYDDALMNGKLVSKQTLNEMMIPRSSSKYGIGLYNVGFAVQSRGVLGGYETFHSFYTDKINISILLNVRDQRKDIRKMCQDIYNIVKY